MSDMRAQFANLADMQAVHPQRSNRDVKLRSAAAATSTRPPRTETNGRLRTLLDRQIAETEQLLGLLCNLDLPILHLSPELRLRQYTGAAARLFGLEAGDLGKWLDCRWPTAPMEDMAEVCRTGTACGRVAEAPDGHQWQCNILPHTAPDGARASVRVILSAPEPVDQRPTEEQGDLTPRQRQIMGLVLAGHASKNIAAHLKISQRTVENHRAAIMQRTGATSLPALARIAVGAAGWADHRLRNNLRALPDLRE